MTTVDMREAKARLSRLVSAVEQGEASEIVIARRGRAVARIVPIRRPPSGRRIGLLAGRYPPLTLEEFDADNESVSASLLGGSR